VVARDPDDRDGTEAGKASPQYVKTEKMMTDDTPWRQSTRSKQRHELEDEVIRVFGPFNAEGRYVIDEFEFESVEDLVEFLRSKTDVIAESGILLENVSKAIVPGDEDDLARLYGFASKNNVNLYRQVPVSSVEAGDSVEWLFEARKD
jgi:hypothetical protein